MIHAFGAYGQEQGAPSILDQASCVLQGGKWTGTECVLSGQPASNGIQKPPLPGYITTEEAAAASATASKKLYYAAAGALVGGLVVGLLLGKAM